MAESLDIKITCSNCNRALNTTLHVYTNDIEISVEPCECCMDEIKEKAYEQAIKDADFE